MPQNGLPSYQRPPVIEVVCGAQFEALEAMSAVHFGKFWTRVAGEYPKTQDREPLAQIFEQPRGTDLKDEVIAAPVPPLRRVLFVSERGDYLLQVQPSRFLANWRKQVEADQYPRFSAAYARFTRGWNDFRAFVDAEGLGTLKLNQYELTYINHVHEAATPFPEGIQEYLAFFSWRNAQSLKFLPGPRATNFGLQFPLPDAQGTLHVTVNHGMRILDKKGVMVIDLTARGPGRGDASDMDAWFGMAHEWIVKGFTDLTTAEAHRRWEREQ